MAAKADKESKGLAKDLIDVFAGGRLCIKIAGRDSNKRCLVVDKIDDRYVLVDGESRRRKVNISHLEPLDQVFKISKNASRDEIKKLFKKEFGTELKDTKAKKTAVRPKKQKAKPAIQVADRKPKDVKPKAGKKESEKKAVKTEKEEKAQVSEEKRSAAKTQKPE